MPFDYGLRLNNRQRIANAREKPTEANKNQSVDGAEGLFLIRCGSPQNVYLLPQRQNFRLERCPRPKQIYDPPNNEPDNISHPATASPDSRSTASQIEFATGTRAPGAMLSAGNLNTAALTLFLALHLSVEVRLPWLLLDDPVQSMDEVHIPQFAALLRTLSKEHGRQVFIAVHDRPLFDYLPAQGDRVDGDQKLAGLSTTPTTVE
jgi:hypothetical protein